MTEQPGSENALQPIPAPEIPANPAAVWPEVRPVAVRLPLRTYLAEVWRRREFAVTVPLGELRAKNQDTMLGQLWHLLNPLMLIGIYFFIFQVVLNIESRRGVDNYLAFLTVGIITFNYTRSSVRSGARMIVKNRSLVQSINFPRAILPMSAMVAETIAYLYGIPVMLAMVMLSGLVNPDHAVYPSWGWLLILPIAAVLMLFNLGLAMITARMTFHFRDVQNILPYLLRLGLYASGVIFPITIVPGRVARTILELNPVYNLIEMMRGAVLYQAYDARAWSLGLGWTAVILVVGFWFFRRAENEYGNV